MTLSLSPWWSLALVVPVLWLGRVTLRGWPWLARRHLPVPVVGGLVMVGALALLEAGAGWRLELPARVSSGLWTWWVTAGAAWGERPAQPLNLPFLVAFFTCVGLNTSGRVLRRGSGQTLLFWGLAALLGVLQTGLGLGLARLLGEPALLGLVCGVVSQTGGHGTALGFADAIAQAGFTAAAPVGAAAATLGLIAGGLIGGPLGSRLIRRLAVAPTAANPAAPTAPAGPADWRRRLVDRLRDRRTWLVLAVLLVLMRIGAELSAFLQAAGWVFPPYLGSMLLGVAVRNLSDLAGWSGLDAATIDAWGAGTLAVFLATAMLQIDLAQLTATAGAMLAIVAAQVGLTAAFARFVTFRCMGRDYDAAVMAAGHCGFALGATPTAVANMDALTRWAGPACRAFLVVPAVGAVLIDFSNALTITVTLNWLR